LGEIKPMNLLEIVNNFMGKWEPIWLFLILAAGLFYERETRNWTIKEFFYDKDKDDLKKQKKTKTTRKITTQPGGSSVTEEQVEISEPMPTSSQSDTSGEQK